MCKVMIIPHVNNETRNNAIKFTEAMAEVMSRDKSHQDGLGYAAIDSQGNLFAERWLVNSQAFKNRAGRTTALSDYSGFINFNYSSYGKVNLEDMSAITLHTRLATTGKGLHNCHPFIENDTSVIHNGIINNAFDFRIDQSTCDSESILTQYVDHGVGKDFELFGKVSTQLDGYYAVGIFSRDSEGRRILDIAKSNSAQLVAMYVDELQCVVFTSLEYQLKEGLKMCGFKVNPVYSVNHSSLVRIDPLKNQVIGITSFSEYERNYLKLTEEKDADKAEGTVHKIKKKKTTQLNWKWDNDDIDAMYNDPHYYGNYGSEYIVRNNKKG